WLLALKREMTDLQREVDGLIRERALEVQIGQAARQPRLGSRGGPVVDFDEAVGDTNLGVWGRAPRALRICLARLFLDQSRDVPAAAVPAQPDDGTHNADVVDDE